jgi:hypothetical protein
MKKSSMTKSSEDEGDEDSGEKAESKPKDRPSASSLKERMKKRK